MLQQQKEISKIHLSAQFYRDKIQRHSAGRLSVSLPSPTPGSKTSPRLNRTATSVGEELSVLTMPLHDDAASVEMPSGAARFVAS